MQLDTKQLLQYLLENDSDLVAPDEAAGRLELVGHKVQNWTVGGNPYRFDHLVAPLRDELVAFVTEQGQSALVADAALAYAEIAWPRFRPRPGYDGEIDPQASVRCWLYRTANTIVGLVADAKRGATVEACVSLPPFSFSTLPPALSILLRRWTPAPTRTSVGANRSGIPTARPISRTNARKTRPRRMTATGSALARMPSTSRGVARRTSPRRCRCSSPCHRC